MTTTAHTRTRTARAAAIIRAIGQRRHRHSASPAQFVCGRCHVAWTGAEADCWSCGQPATSEHNHRGAALLRLLHPVQPTPAKAATQ
ncbi:hypothetical protein H3146_04085 [Streptomyces sp. OF3]|uniref:Uncharacterized protein n=1 Tax=Streptomyces alkaliterrae TaxID=2213162 RepID=A0A7W3WIL7_9ACTN|nr:hypothetical protein [Streptomyces alkaliterrae]MBB1252555.1 hypothetical protein [Streptomyces alkaliterrae]